MSIQKSFQISASQLADWIEEKGLDKYWIVDSDRVLNGDLGSPCPADELGGKLRRIGKALVVEPPVVLDPQIIDPLSPTFLDSLCEEEELGVAVLQLRWGDSEVLWLLYEDEETSESVRREREEASEKGH